MDYDKIIILLIAIIVVGLVVGVLFLTNPVKQDVKIVVMTNETVHVGSTFLVELTDLFDNPLANESITITVIDNKSNTVINKQLVTNYEGEAALEITNISSGNYTVNITFDGNDVYDAYNLTYKLRIINDAVESLSSDPASTDDGDSGAFYSGQAGRTVYSGEIQLGPDGHHWKHLGNNQWVKVD